MLRRKSTFIWQSSGRGHTYNGDKMGGDSNNCNHNHAFHTTDGDRRDDADRSYKGNVDDRANNRSIMNDDLKHENGDLVASR